MDATVVGIDVSKDNFPPAGRAPLDIAVVPRKDVFSPSRDAAGLDALIARLVPLAPKAVAVEATGGFETVVAASLAAGSRTLLGPPGVKPPNLLRSSKNNLPSLPPATARDTMFPLCGGNKSTPPDPRSP